MIRTSSINHDSVKDSSFAKKSQLLITALLGFSILMVVGFAPMEVIHNATHDTRHSTGFPCH